MDKPVSSNMKKPVARKIKELIKAECKRLNIPFTNQYYRRAKKAYSTIPWTKKELVG